MVEISIIIPSYESKETLVQVLNAINLQNPSIDKEVIIVDSSGNSSVDHIVSDYKKFILLKHEKRISASEARNIGAGNSKGQLLLFLDADVALEKNALDEALRYSKESSIFTGSLTLESLNFIVPFLEFCYFFSESLEGNPNTTRNNIPGGLFFVKRDIFFANNQFKNMGRAEDVELSEGIRKSGFVLNFNPKIKATLYQRVSFFSFIRKCWINGINYYNLRFPKVHMLSRFFLVFLAPVFGMLKFLRMIYRNIFYRKNIKEILCFLLALPIIALANVVWALGIVKAALTNQGLDQRH